MRDFVRAAYRVVLRRDPDPEALEWAAAELESGRMSRATFVGDLTASDEFARVRIGVGKPPGRQLGADHVLRRPGKAEREALDTTIEIAADAVEMILAEGVEAAMTRFNART